MSEKTNFKPVIVEPNSDDIREMLGITFQRADELGDVTTKAFIRLNIEPGYGLVEFASDLLLHATHANEVALLMINAFQVGGKASKLRSAFSTLLLLLCFWLPAQEPMAPDTILNGQVYRYTEIVDGNTLQGDQVMYLVQEDGFSFKLNGQLFKYAERATFTGTEIWLIGPKKVRMSFIKVDGKYPVITLTYREDNYPSVIFVHQDLRHWPVLTKALLAQCLTGPSEISDDGK